MINDISIFLYPKKRLLVEKLVAIAWNFCHRQAITIWLIRTLSASDFEGMIEAGGEEWCGEKPLEWRMRWYEYISQA